MLLIPLVEQIVGGSMPLWPRVTLQFLFYFSPTSLSADSIAAFLFGNGLPCSLALRLVRVCHGGGATDGLLQLIRSLYDWNSSPDGTYFSVYWDMRLEHFLWLNGSNGLYPEFFTHLGRPCDDTVTGFGSTPRDQVMSSRLFHIRHTVKY